MRYKIDYKIRKFLTFIALTVTNEKYNFTRHSLKMQNYCFYLEALKIT